MFYVALSPSAMKHVHLLLGDAGSGNHVHQSMKSKVLLGAVLQVASIKDVPGAGPKYPDQILGQGTIRGLALETGQLLGARSVCTRRIR